jgi:hypothetical protein
VGALYKKEILIRQVSTVSKQGAIDFTKDWLNDNFQEVSSNKSNGDYIDFFFADIFDSRNGDIYRVFADACSDEYSLTDTVFDVLVPEEFVSRVDFDSIANDLDSRITALENESASITSFSDIGGGNF